MGYEWEGCGWYASRGEYHMGASWTSTRKINMDGWQEWEAGQASRQQGYGTPRWYDSEEELRAALGLE